MKQPKSYLSSEPGAMRALANKFDPYLQVYNRILALKNIGHNTSKIELIILGGTWSYYPKPYQMWFIKRCFDALNANIKGQIIRKGKEYNKPRVVWKDIIKVHKKNENSNYRSVGLSIETRPDFIDINELIRLRKLGVTKIQLGIQTTNIYILKANQREHTVNDIKNGINLIRLAGFKIHIHWMANLYKSNPKKDYESFKKIFDDVSIKPDEIKIYPCSIIKGTKLFSLYKQSEYKPYSEQELLELLIKCKEIVPEYCRISRLVRDIPSYEIVDGLKKTNFRQIIQQEMSKRNLKCNCIRCREIGSCKLKIRNIKFKMFQYKTKVANEYFLNYIDSKSNKILGFLRLSLPLKTFSENHFIKELKNSAVIREVHVYGPSLQISGSSKTAIQHLGLGKKLITKAEEIAKYNGFNYIAVISAIGTRGYYRKFGYKDGNMYMLKSIL